MTSGDSRMMWAHFSLRQFKLLHQVTKEIPNLDTAVLTAAGCPEPIARRLVEVVRRGRADIGEHRVVRLGFDDATVLELRREIATRTQGDALEIDSGTTTAAAQVWRRVGQSIADTLGTPEFDHRTGATVKQATEVMQLLDKEAPTAESPSDPTAP
jgi:hypothetical protein